MIPLFKDILRHMSRRRRVQLATVVLLMLAGAFAEMMTLGAVVPFLGLLVNPSVLNENSLFAGPLNTVASHLGTSKLVVTSLVFIFFAVAAACLRLFLSWYSVRFVFGVGGDFAKSVYENIILQPYSYHIAKNSSDTLATTEKVAALVVGVLMPAMQMFISLVMVISILGAMLWVDYATSVLAGSVFAAMYIAISSWSKQRLHRNSHTISLNGSSRIKAIQEGLGGIRDVIIDGTHKIYVSQFSKADRAQRVAQANNAVLASSPKYIVECAGMILFVGISLILTNEQGAAKSIPILGALAIGAQRLLPYMQVIYNAVASIRGNMASAVETVGFLKLQEKSESSSDENLITEDNNNIFFEMRDVVFAYGDINKPTIRKVSLAINRGEKIGVIGKTGSGKSTLIDICMGLLQPTSGSILVYGVPLTPNNIRAWQRRIAHVPQSIFLTDATILENVAFGVQPADVDSERVASAIKQAQLSDFIDSLPNGLLTRVGERGVQLSGGQRQRIGIARALYKKADVLVLDEATSALDEKTEMQVMDSIYRLRPDLVIIIIAHRTSTLAKCDKIFLVEDGNLIDRSGDI